MDFPPSELAEFPLDGPLQLQGSFVHVLQLDRISHIGKRKALPVTEWHVFFHTLRCMQLFDKLGWIWQEVKQMFVNTVETRVPSLQHGSFCQRNVTHHVQQDPEWAALDGILQLIQWPTLIGNSFAQTKFVSLPLFRYLRGGPIELLFQITQKSNYISLSQCSVLI